MKSQFFTDLAGSNFLTIPNELKRDSILELFTELKLAKYNKIKIIFDNYDPEFISNLISNFANNSNLSISISQYNSNFFVFNREESITWLDNYSIASLVVEHIKLSDFENIEIVKNLLVNSFAIKITKDNESKTVFEDDILRSDSILGKFEKSFSQDGLNTFLVKSEQGDIVGCYSLIKIGNEVQLSGVAGRTSLKNSYKGKKLIMLCQSMIHSFLNSEDFSDVKYLTLSNSKKPVAQMYSELNIPKNNNRKGLLVEFI
jgi:hypothetical protein